MASSSAKSATAGSGGGGGTITMPDLVGSLAEQVRAFSDETLTCALYQLSHPRPGLDSAVELLATFTHTSHNPRGHVDAALYLNERVLQLPRRPVAFSYACRSQSALRLLLEELLWEPTARYWLVLRRLPANNTATTTTKDDDDEASAGSHTWPPAPRIPVPHPDFGFPQGNAVNTGYVARHRLLHELAPLFPAREGCFVKILYQEEWEASKDNPVAWTGSYDEARAWCRRMGAACAEAVYALVADG